MYIPWCSLLRARLLEEFPLPLGTSPIPDGAPLPSRFSLLRAFPPGTDFDAPQVDAQVHDTPPDANVPNCRREPGAVAATLLANDRVTPKHHFQDVRLLSLSLPTTPPSSLPPGSCITLYPSNPQSAVHDLLTLQNYHPLADTPLSITPPQTLLPPSLHTSPPITLRALITHHISLLSVPRRSFFKSILPYISPETHPSQHERLTDFTLPQYTDELYDYTTRPRRTILEVLAEFNGVRIPAHRLLDVFPLLRGRDFSIANGGDTLVHGAGAKVDLLVAMVKYQTILKKPREGLCSRYIAALEPGTELRVMVKGATTPMPEGRVVAVATGTGVAPVRALLHRQRQVLGGSRVEEEAVTTLFFGTRGPETSFYFADEMLPLSSSSSTVTTTDANTTTQEEKPRPHLPVTLIPAFSQSPTHPRLYVQDQISAHAPLVADLILRRGADVLLCGGSVRMAEACKNAVREAIRMDMGGEGVEEGRVDEVFGRVGWWQEIWD